MNAKNVRQIRLKNMEFESPVADMISQRFEFLWNRLFALPKARIWAA
jgi:hypothetical protein